MEILFEVKNSTGVITLSRPKALNALNLNMAIQLSKKLKEWEDDNAVERVILLGEGNHFCAGGDVKSVHLSGPFSELKREFFSKEYSLNLQIKNFPKPYLSIWKGVVMGGGVGLSIYGDYRIATDSTKFAMPETSIGFFPDVGASFFLSRMENNIGKYLGLTGELIQCKDLLNFGLATHYCREDKLEILINQYILDGSIVNHEIENSSSFSEEKLDFINKNFTGDIYEILKKITAKQDQDNLLNRLISKCPMSLAVTTLLINNSSKRTLKECLEIEYRLSQKMVNRHDFGEGIEAVLIEKHHNPQWQPSSTKEINLEDLNKIFASSIDNELKL
ncbi:enoyl-CoA hydratase/isomerase family protein [Pelagibacteraceae bacterium]|jgi:enoyl-CoA hydratase/carnithine racemase|nr:enoyl-CoA hydratase/isomerase family protein [Pelagibacteraceae bacterium]